MVSTTCLQIGILTFAYFQEKHSSVLKPEQVPRREVLQGILGIQFVDTDAEQFSACIDGLVDVLLNAGFVNGKELSRQALASPAHQGRTQSLDSLHR
jgi:hypothetical protein